MNLDTAIQRMQLVTCPNRTRLPTASWNTPLPLKLAPLVLSLDCSICCVPIFYNIYNIWILPIHQKPMARKKLHEVLRMRPATRRAWIHHLEEATKSWERNKYLATPGQRTLLDYFTGSAPPRPPPRNIAREAWEQANIGILRLEHDQVRIDNVLNPVE